VSTTSTLDGTRHEMERFGPVAYLVTVSEVGGPHCVSGPVRRIGDLLVMAPGKRSLDNASVRGRVTLM
jgi:hypothetical protein